MIVEENGKKYDIDESTGLVRLASADTQVDEADYSDELRIGDRVEVAGETGTVISLTASMYGGAYGVKFDNGTIDEFGPSALKLTTVEAPVEDTPYNEVVSRFEAYEKLPAYTNNEITAKEREARYLNLRAKSLATDSKLSFDDQNALGRIVLVTGNDLTDLKTARENSDESNEYRSRFNRYTIASDVSGYGAALGLTGDASWLGDAIDDMEIVETTDADLAVRAAELVSAFSKQQLEDDDFMQVAASYHRGYLQMSDDQAKQFESYLARARQDRIAELPAETAKEASTDDLDNFDTSALFL